MPGMGDRGPPARAWEADGVQGGSEDPVEKVGKTGRMGGVEAGEQGVRGGHGAMPSLEVLEQREELRWHFRAASLASGVG